MVNNIKVIVGLGNERAALKASRHNVGFRAVEKLWEETKDQNGNRVFGEWQRRENTSFQNYAFAEGKIDGVKYILLKPLALDPNDLEYKFDADGKVLVDDQNNPIKNPSYGFGDINHAGIGFNQFLQDRAKAGESIKLRNVFVIGDEVAALKTPITVKQSSPAELLKSHHNGLKNIGEVLGEEASGFLQQIQIPVGRNDPNKSKNTNQSAQVSLTQFVLQTPEAATQELEDKTTKLLVEELTKITSGAIKDISHHLAEDEKRRSAVQAQKDKLVAALEKSKITDLDQAINSFQQKYSLAENISIEAIDAIAKNLVKDKTDPDKQADLKIANILISQLRIAQCDEYLHSGKMSDYVRKFVLKIPDQTPSQSDALTLSEQLKDLSACGEEEINNFFAKNIDIINFDFIELAISAVDDMTLDLLIEFLKQNQRGNLLLGENQNGDTLLHLALKRDKPQLAIELLLEEGLNPDSKNNAGTTAIHLALEMEKAGLNSFYSLLKKSHLNPDDENEKKLIAEYQELSESKQSSYILTQQDYPSEAQKDRLLPHQLIKHHYREKLKIFTPYADAVWLRSPAQALEGFGASVKVPDYNIGDNQLFSDTSAIKELAAQIRESIINSNGVVILGNYGNIDPKWCTDNQNIDLQNLGQRRAFVEMIAFATAIELGKPIWAICGGTQVALTALGGKMVALKTPQDLRGKNDTMDILAGSQLDPACYDHSQIYPTQNIETFSAHYQGLQVQCPDPKLPIDQRFQGLPAGIEVIATSATNPEIPKVYAYKIDGELAAILAQNHLEGCHLGTNPYHQTVIEHSFIDRCRADQQGLGSKNPDRLKTAQTLLDFIGGKVGLDLLPSKSISPRDGSQKNKHQLEQLNNNEKTDSPRR
ncbi:MAG: gamma-glutamyl-gamma-aminobutyrate hydrolase family protein [Pseudomonadota bacterium]